MSDHHGREDEMAAVPSVKAERDTLAADLAAAQERAETIREALKRAYPYVMDALREAEENCPGCVAIVLEDLEQFIVPALHAGQPEGEDAR